MDFERPSGYDARRAAALEFARQHVAPSAAARDRAARWDHDLFQQMGSAGLLGAVLPEDYGGGGLSPLDACAQQEGFGAGGEDAGLALAWACHTLLCAVPLWQLGTETQRRRHLPALCRGERVGALAEGADLPTPGPTAVRARPLRQGGAWILDGRVPFVINAPVASVFVVTALTAPERGPDGVSAFVVEKGTPGLTVGPTLDTGGLRTALGAEVVFDSCEIPSPNILGPEGGGVTRVLRLARLWERSVGLAPWIGLLQALFDRSLTQARERLELGRPLSSFQSVRATLADMKIRLELCRRMQMRAAWALGASDAMDERGAAETHLFLAESAHWLAGQVQRLHRAPGASTDPFPERASRDAARLTIGTDLLRSVIAGSLLNLG